MQNLHLHIPEGKFFPLARIHFLHAALRALFTSWCVSAKNALLVSALSAFLVSANFARDS
jgi:hypothetical protein